MKKDKYDICFVNYEKAECGCKVKFSDGYGEYANVIFVTFCEKHKTKETK
ncbi:hypothetical protein LCGC14_2202710 [marine sediment metagenome]|uniref:Uncharacterized protein n=1 Tax=marine sediment metagenome TaxID=412755 RepID=A0A0F9FTK3_9ZZZZ